MHCVLSSCPYSMQTSQSHNPKHSILGPVHTNADSFQSLYFLIRLGLLSALTRGSDPPNPYKFGNALESG